MDNHDQDGAIIPDSGNASTDASQKVRKRTKTGCLTCRKRRIKCGEERPICNNCVKSKRQCEGYFQRIVFKPTGEQWPGMTPMGYATANIPISPHSMGIVPGYGPGQAFSTLPAQTHYGIPIDEHGNPIHIIPHVGSPIELSAQQYQLPPYPFSSSNIQPVLYASHPTPHAIPDVSPISPTTIDPYYQQGYVQDSNMLPIQTQLPFMIRNGQIPMSDSGFLSRPAPSSPTLSNVTLLLQPPFEQHGTVHQMPTNVNLKLENDVADSHGIKRDSADPLDQMRGSNRELSGMFPFYASITLSHTIQGDLGL
jgi:hypothetical protein